MDFIGYVINPNKEIASKKENNKKNSTVPKKIIVLFALIFIIAFVNSINSFNSSGIKPFGFIENVLAEVGLLPSRNIGELAAALKGDEPIKDSLDRCEIIDPVKGVFPVSEANKSLNDFTPLGDNLGGTNLAPVLDNGPATDIVDIAVSYGNSFVLGMVQTQNSISNAAAFIKYSNQQGILPIIRLCYPNAQCEFNLSGGNSADLINFYTNLSNQVGSNEFIAMLGPNEAGTAGEMQTFKTSSYADLVKAANDAGNQLQRFRPVNGGNMYLSPGAFNLSNAENDDAKNILGGGLNSGLFDYILGNAYDLSSSPAYNQYLSTGQGFAIKDYVDQNGLKMIFTETGSFTGNTEQMVATVQQFCSDDSIDGFLFFRSYAEYESISPTPHPEFFSRDEMEKILSGCSGEAIDRKYDGENAWASCNLDSCLYEDKYSTNSDASICGKEPKSGTGTGALLQMDCGDGSDLTGETEDITKSPFCYTRKLNTVEVAAPIKQFGNNSAAGTLTNPYTPLCVELANQVVSNNTIDALNQFAGRLKSNDKTEDYPMPWLGSALNCAIILQDSSFYSQNLKEAPTPSLGSLISETLKEISLEKDYPQTNKDAYTIDGDFGSVIDEKLICVGDACLEKGSNDTFLSSIRDYSVLDRPNSYQEVNACNDLKFIDDPSNYVIGPELKLSEEPEVATKLSGNDFCLLYGKRNLAPEADLYNFKAGGLSGPDDIIAPDNLSCFVRPEPTVDINGVTYTCGQLMASGSITCQDGRALTSQEGSVAEFQKGDCAVNPIYHECVNYAHDRTNPVYIKSNGYGDIPEYKIPGAYDALYSQYNRIQDQLSSRGLKIVFRENLGMKFNVSTKIRDANREVGGEFDEVIEEKPKYYYDQELSCKVPDLFNNEYYLARGSATKTEYQYYDWLGYLDLIQELMVSYVNDPLLSAEKFVENPYINSEKLKDENGEIIDTLYSVPLILRTSESALMTSYGLYSCDDEEILKYDESVPEEERLPKGIKRTCITYIEDERYKDELGNFLCNKGYKIKGECEPEENICKVPKKEKDNYSTSSVNCSGAACSNLPGDYPTCPTTDYSLCDDPSQMNVLFGDGNPDLPTLSILSCQERATAIGNGIDKETITFLGVRFTVNKKIVPQLKLVEEEVLKYAKSRDGATFEFESGKYTFQANGGFNARPQRGYESDDKCLISNHAWGTALDFNATTNPFTSQCGADGTLNTDMPPEVVYAFEKYGFRWGGRYGNTADPMHFEYCLDPKNISKSNTENEEDEDDDKEVSIQKGVTCPLQGGMCLQGPYGSFSHGVLNAVDLSYPGNTVGNLYAPFEGKIVEVFNGIYCKDGYTAGIGIYYQGEVNDQIITLFMYHLSPKDLDTLKESVKASRVYKTGEEIAKLATPGEPGAESLTCEGSKGSAHTHIEYATNTPPYIPNQKGPFDLRALLYGLGCIQTTNNACQIEDKDIVDIDDVLECRDPSFPNPMNPGDYKPGVLSCNIDITNTNDKVDFTQNQRQIEARVQAYNLDNNQSYTWLANPEKPESGNLKERLVNFLGSEEAFRNDWEQRAVMTQFLIDGAIDRGLNPRLAFSLWVEETAGGAVGGHALGCGVLYLPEIPYGQGFDAMKQHLTEQLDCLERFTNATEDFEKFMCTFSGEEPINNSLENVDGVYVRQCNVNEFTNNPNFPNNLCKYYNYLPI